MHKFQSIKKFLIYLIFLISLQFQVGCSLFSGEPHPLLKKEVPYTRYTLIDGSYHSFEELKGKNVVLVFWAEWCSYSKPVIERLNELAKNNKDNNLVFMAISIDSYDNFPKLEERIIHGKLTNLTHAFSGNALQDEAYMAFQADALPDVYAINKDGVVVAQGHSWKVAKVFSKN